jgi:hypothetical protein
MVMALAVLVLGGIVVMNGVLSKNNGSQSADTTEASVSPTNESVNPGQSAQSLSAKAPVTNVVATTPDEDRDAAIDKELDVLKEALLNGESDPASVETVRARFTHPESEVRKAAFETAMHLNDRGSIPKLKEALAKVQDPREKVMIMDAIEYLQIKDVDMGQIVSNAAEVLSDSPSAAGALIPRRATPGREPAAPPKQ